jgi:NADH:ubiquinone oxidoreductase subunit E
MPVRDGAAIRKKRIDLLLEIIARHQDDPTWTRDKIIAYVSRQTGLTPRTVREYLLELIDFCFVIEEGVYLRLP